MCESAIKNAQQYAVAARHTKNCIGLCLRLLASFYTWPGFEDASNQHLLKSSLVAICNGDIESTVKVLTSEAITKIMDIENTILDLTSAVQHVSST